MIDVKKTSEKIVNFRRLLEKDIEADKEEWADLVNELIPLNLRLKWRDWIRENIDDCINQGMETQSELLILTFLSLMKESETNSEGEQNSTDSDRKYANQEVRDRQSDFVGVVSKNCKFKCVITGCRVASRLEAAHIVPHAEEVNYDYTNGILIRSDIHRMLDSGDCAINPETKLIYFDEDLLNMDKDLRQFNKNKIEEFESDINWNGFRKHWSDFINNRNYDQGV